MRAQYDAVFESALREEKKAKGHSPFEAFFDTLEAYIRGRSLPEDTRVKMVRRCRLLRGLLPKTRIANTSPTLYVRMIEYDWVRPLDTWQPKGKSGNSQLRILIDHLYVIYPVPAFLYQAWEAPADRWVNIFLELAQGGKRHKIVPRYTYEPLTKKMVNLFLNSKADCALQEAVRRAQIAAYTGDNLSWTDRLTKAVMGCSLGEVAPAPDDPHFHQTILHWFARQSMLDPGMVAPLWDYITYQKEENAGWSIKGRTATSMLKGMEGWHRALAGVRVGGKNAYLPSGFSRGHWVVEAPDLGDKDARWVFCVEEILHPKNLAAEGRDMSHCVYTYAHQIVSRKTSIWGLRRYKGQVNRTWDEEKEEEVETLEILPNIHKRHLTIEVRNKSRQIVQIRGRANRPATAVEYSYVVKWARLAGLTFGR